MDGPSNYHTKSSKPDRERQIYDVTYMYMVKHGTNESINKTEIESQM